MRNNLRLNRRDLLVGASATLAVSLSPVTLSASGPVLQELILERFGDTPINSSRVLLDIPALAENGNSVAMKVTVQSPMRDSDFVRAIHIFAPANPLPDVATFYLTPACGRAEVSTRIRLGDSQIITAIAEMNDGSLWEGSAKTVVTLAACIEPLL